MTPPMVERDIAEFLPAEQRHLFQDCLLQAPQATLDKIAFRAPPAPGLRKGFRVVVTASDLQGRVKIALGPGQGRIQIDTSGPVNLDIRTWRHCTFTLGEGTTVNQARVVCDEADIVVGRDGLWSDEILVQSNDQHGIVDLKTMSLCNAGRRRIVIGDHVWIGRRSMVMPDVEIGKGAILAAGAVLTTDMPANTIYAGIPARQIRDQVSWSRATSGFSEQERLLMNLSGT